jgi:hypothetical protein
MNLGVCHDRIDGYLLGENRAHLSYLGGPFLSHTQVMMPGLACLYESTRTLNFCNLGFRHILGEVSKEGFMVTTT